MIILAALLAAAPLHTGSAVSHPRWDKVQVWSPNGIRHVRGKAARVAWPDCDLTEHFHCCHATNNRFGDCAHAPDDGSRAPGYPVKKP